MGVDRVPVQGFGLKVRNFNVSALTLGCTGLGLLVLGCRV